MINSGNGAAGPVIDALNHKLKQSGVNTDFVYLHHKLTLHFPMASRTLENNRARRRNLWLGAGQFRSSIWWWLWSLLCLTTVVLLFLKYVIGLLSKVFLSREKGAKIVHDPRVIWNTQMLWPSVMARLCSLRRSCLCKSDYEETPSYLWWRNVRSSLL